MGGPCPPTILTAEFRIQASGLTTDRHGSAWTHRAVVGAGFMEGFMGKGGMEIGTWNRTISSGAQVLRTSFCVLRVVVVVACGLWPKKVRFLHKGI